MVVVLVSLLVVDLRIISVFLVFSVEILLINHVQVFRLYEKFSVIVLSFI